MKLNSATIALLLLTLSDVCGFSLFSNPIDVMVQAIRKKTKIEVMEGVGLPTDTENLPVGKPITNFLQFSKKTNIDVAKTLFFPDGLKKFIDKLPEADEKKDLSKTIPVEPNRSAYF